MEAILKTTETPMLEDAYKTYIGRVLKETSAKDVTKTSEKEEKVLAEGEKKEVVSGVVKSGDNKDQLDEDAILAEAAPKQQPTISDAEKRRWQRLAGIGA